jgi:outer membrane protein assembly factor BamB
MVEKSKYLSVISKFLSVGGIMNEISPAPHRVVMLLLSLSLAASIAIAGNWPAWRGDGSGVSAELNVPVEWGVEKNVRWKTRIGGNGISSPIVWGDRVFVTSAFESDEISVGRVLVPGAAAVLLVLALASGFSAMRRRARDGEGEEAFVRRVVIRWLDPSVTIVSVAGFMVGATLLLTRLKALYYVGEVAPAWLWSSLFCSLGLVAAMGLLRPASVWRPIGVLVLVAAALGFYFGQPLNKYGEPIAMRKIVVVMVPLLGGALWHALVFAIARAGRRSPKPRKRVVWAAPVGAMALTALVVLVFLCVNYLKAQTGLARVLVCLDRGTGELLWKSKGFIKPGLRKHYVNSYATPTPVTDGKYVVASFGDGVFCVDFGGNVLWRRMEPNYARFLRYGAGSSPIMDNGRVIYAFMTESIRPSADDLGYFPHEEFSYLASFDARTGEMIWKTRPPGAHDSYNTPVLIPQAPESVIMLGTWRHVVAINPTNGEELWSLPIPVNQPVPTLAVDPTTVYVAGGSDPPKAMVAVNRPTIGNPQEDATVRWTLRKSIPESSSPVLLDELLYWVTDSGVASCVDAATGVMVWQARLGDRHFASPVAADGRIYFVGKGGDTTVIHAGREFEILAVNSIGETSYASPAISDGQIFLRGSDHVFCIENRQTPR